MNTWQIVLLIIIAVLLAVLVALYFLGKRLQKKKDESDRQMEAASQTIPMLIIDKKKMKLKEAGLPPIVYEQTPKLLRRQKVPVVKAKVGPRIQTFLCDAAVFDDIPLKKEVRVTASGLYITGVKGLRKPLEKAEKPKKKKFFQRMQDKAKAMQTQQEAQKPSSGKKKK
uniref:Uncharacterized protein n=1 Tax=Eubacterium plexicaudatum ASF492 TaxID=1235802 RepID=N2A0D2_9FIRM